jgi:hydrogenase maturation protease
MTTCADHGCLILACGNSLRGDDGASLRLADDLQLTPLPDGVRILVQQQWTPELAEDIAAANSVLFLDCALTQTPGSVTLTPVIPASTASGFLTHHQDASALLAFAQSFYGRIPEHCAILLIGAQSIEHSESISMVVKAALPKALDMLLGWIDLHCPKHFTL